MAHHCSRRFSRGSMVPPYTPRLPAGRRGELAGRMGILRRPEGRAPSHPRPKRSASSLRARAVRPKRRHTCWPSRPAPRLRGDIFTSRLTMTMPRS